MLSLNWCLTTARTRLPVRRRRQLQRAASRILAPVGSINGAKRASSAVALTFDDGPAPAVTGRLLDLLRARGARATFFVLTDRARVHPAIVRRMIAEGHEVALHADSHERLTDLPFAEVRRRLQTARGALATLTGQPVRFFRPPFGAQSLGTYLAARSCGLEVVVWGPFAQDWIDGSPEAVAARGLTRLAGGDILLLHDGLETPDGTTTSFDRVRAFELILDGLDERGFTTATVSALIAGGNARRTAWFRH